MREPVLIGKELPRKPTKCLHREEALRRNTLEGAGGAFEGYAIRSGETKDGELAATPSLPEFFLGSAREDPFHSERIPPQAAELPRNHYPAGTAGQPGPSLGPNAAGHHLPPGRQPLHHTRK